MNDLNSNNSKFISFYFHFSHWTYDVTGGYLHVIDLQGVDRSDKYILTDPCIHCYEPRFGNTNLGVVGMKFFFQTHRCGDVCEKMKLKKNRFMKTTSSKFMSYKGTKLF